MKLSMLISPGIWDLLERLRPHLDVTIDLFDRSLAPLIPHRDAPIDTVVRTMAAAAASADDPSDRFQAAVRTGHHQVVAVGALRLGLFPLRSDRTVIGLLVAAGATPGESEAAVGGGRGAANHDTDLERRLERLGWSLRATIEADISTHARLSDEEQRSRWVATILRFLEHLSSCPNERELFQTVVEGAAIWGDFDARVYRRTLGGSFVLEAALASVVATGVPRSFPSAVLATHPGVTRITSIAELEQLGAVTSLGEMLVMPLPGTEPAPYLFTVGGVVDAHFERVFSVVCRTLGSCVDQLATARARELQARLMRHVNDARLRFPAHATTLLGEIAAATGATHARLLLGERAGQAPRVLAAAGGSALASLPTEFPAAGSIRRPDRLVVGLDLGEGRPAWLDLGTTTTREFTHADAVLAEAGARVAEVWLAGAMQALAMSATGQSGPLAPQGFEARIQEEVERARRFRLEAGLLLVEPEAAPETHVLALAPMLETLRGQLRASDLVGRLVTGQLAALLVHTNAEGGAVVAARLRPPLMRVAIEGGLRGIRLGTAAYPASGDTATALIAAARADLESERRAAPAVTAPDHSGTAHSAPR